MYSYYMHKILLPNSKGEDLLMKNFFSRHQKEQSDSGRVWQHQEGALCTFLPQPG